MTDAITCRSCGEQLPPTGDAFCTFCHEPLEEEYAPVSEAQESEGNVNYSISSSVFGFTCETRKELVFDRCYKCDATSNLTTTSVATSRSIASYLFVFIRGIELLKNRTSVRIPICADCRFSIWPLRFIHLIAFMLCFVLPYLFSILLGKGNAAEWSLISMIAGPLVVLTSYVFFRDWLLCVQVHNANGNYRYIVAKRFREDFENDVSNQFEGAAE